MGNKNPSRRSVERGGGLNLFGGVVLQQDQVSMTQGSSGSDLLCYKEPKLRLSRTPESPSEGRSSARGAPSCSPSVCPSARTSDLSSAPPKLCCSDHCTSTPSPSERRFEGTRPFTALALDNMPVSKAPAQAGLIRKEGKDGKVYYCTVENCGVSFKKLEHAQRHERTRESLEHPPPDASKLTARDWTG